jgi:hypothetical protein
MTMTIDEIVAMFVSEAEDDIIGLCIRERSAR